MVTAAGVPTAASAAARSEPVAIQQIELAAPPAVEAGGVLVTTPAAPGGIGITATPTISPSVTTKNVAPGGTYTCSSGYFCAQVWAGSAWKVFFLYTCQIYDLNNWTGTGYWRNRQSSGAPNPYLLGSQGIPIHVLAKSPSSGSVDWGPVYSISPCY
ncbi:hypothetical protein [Micromonospora aurantiaca (nom. illeg.)]